MDVVVGEMEVVVVAVVVVVFFLQVYAHRQSRTNMNTTNAPS